jgi:hypothetical protein
LAQPFSHKGANNQSTKNQTTKEEDLKKIFNTDRFIEIFNNNLNNLNLLPKNKDIFRDEIYNALKVPVVRYFF